MKGVVEWANPYGETPAIGSWWSPPAGYERHHARVCVASYRKLGVMVDIRPKMLPPWLVTWEEFRDFRPADTTP